MLELCAGAGQIGLLADRPRAAPPVCVDVNPAAGDHILPTPGGRAGAPVEVRTARLEEALDDDERFAVVIADPPWVPRAEVGRFPEDPLLAIDGGDDGLELARACVDVAAAHLLPGGSALLQLGTAEQADIELALPDSLRLVEVRTFERGVVARFDRPQGVTSPAAPCGCRRTTAARTTCRTGRRR